MPRRQLVLAVDVGTTKAAALVAEGRADAELAVLGIAATPVMGVKRGLVVDVERAAQSLRDAVNRAVSMAGVEPTDVVGAVNGEHVRARVASAEVDLGGRAVHDTDIEALVNRAARSAAEPGREVVRVVRGPFRVDGLPTGGSPQGLSVHRLGVEVVVISAESQPLRNLRRTVQLAELRRVRWIPAGLAASYGALSEDERMVGAVLLDVGGGTTQVVVWNGGVPRLMAVVPVGGELVTSDLAVGLGVVAAQAERLKVERGHVVEAPEGTVELRGVTGQAAKTVALREVRDIIAARVDEWLGLLEQALAQITWTKAPAAGVVMTGGGALLRGLERRVEEAWGWPVRLGAPTGLAGLSDLARSPGYSVVVGLAKLALADGMGFRRDTAWTRIAQAWLRTWS
ncbi:MAG: cell division protein FtsA [Actinomycetia bacterium]|nr:cell division protein FtsA [Actinomycetes bacterium]